MSENYTCPQDGCDFGESEDKSLASVRGHITSASGHDWDELKADLYAQAEDGDEDGAEGEAEEGDPGEVPGPNGETGHLGGVEGGDDQNDDQGGDEMATQDEYEEQYQDDDQPTDDGDDDADQPADDGDDSAGFSVPAVGGTTLLALAAVVLVAFIAWRVLGNSGTNYEEPEEQADSDDGDPTMVDIDAGTGGVQT